VRAHEPGPPLAIAHRLPEEAGQGFAGVRVDGELRRGPGEDPRLLEAVVELGEKRIAETLYLLAIPGMRESIKAGMKEPLAKSAKDLKW